MGSTIDTAYIMNDTKLQMHYHNTTIFYGIYFYIRSKRRPKCMLKSFGIFSHNFASRHCCCLTLDPTIV